MIANLDNDVAIAVEKVGGPTRVANLLKVSNTTIHTWIKNDRVPSIEQAMKLADLAGLPYSLLRRAK